MRTIFGLPTLAGTIIWQLPYLGEEAEGRQQPLCISIPSTPTPGKGSLEYAAAELNAANTAWLLNAPTDGSPWTVDLAALREQFHLQEQKWLFGTREVSPTVEPGAVLLILPLSDRSVASTRRAFMERTLEISRNCVAEGTKPRPYVGAVIVRDGQIVGEAYRGELGPGEHAEYTLLEHKLAGRDLRGTTLFVTLEPCTVRTHPKVPCANRIVDRGIAEVVVGIIDPNDDIRGQGYWRLLDRQIRLSIFDPDLANEIAALNRAFIEFQKAASAARLRGDVEIRIDGSTDPFVSDYVAVVSSFAQDPPIDPLNPPAPSGMLLSSSLSSIHVVNNSGSATQIQSVRLGLFDEKSGIEYPGVQRRIRLSGSKELAARSSTKFAIDFDAHFDFPPAAFGGPRVEIRLCVDAAGFPIVTQPIPSSLLVGSAANNEPPRI